MKTLSFTMTTFFNSRRGQQLAKFFSAIFSLYSLFLLLQTAQLIKQFSYPTQSTTHQSLPMPIQAIPNWHLFGNARQDQIPLTDLPVQLSGIFYNGDQTSAAVIAFAGQPSKLYKIGDALGEDAVIADILPKSVLLKRNGQLERLPLPEKLLFP